MFSRTASRSGYRRLTDCRQEIVTKSFATLFEDED